MSEDFDFDYHEEEHPSAPKVLTIVGRSSSITEFENTLKSHLNEPFKVKVVIPLEQDDEAKNFLAYVDPGSDWREVSEEGYEGLAEFLENVGMYGVELHDSPVDALNYVNEVYKHRAYGPFREPIHAHEIARRDILLGLIATGLTGITRGLLDGKPVVVIVHGVEGQGEQKDTLVTPYAIMVDEELGKKLEIPFPSSFDQ